MNAILKTLAIILLLALFSCEVPTSNSETFGYIAVSQEEIVDPDYNTTARTTRVHLDNESLGPGDTESLGSVNNNDEFLLDIRYEMADSGSSTFTSYYAEYNASISDGHIINVRGDKVYQYHSFTALNEALTELGLENFEEPTIVDDSDSNNASESNGLSGLWTHESGDGTLFFGTNNSGENTVTQRLTQSINGEPGTLITNMTYTLSGSTMNCIVISIELTDSPYADGPTEYNTPWSCTFSLDGDTLIWDGATYYRN